MTPIFFGKISEPRRIPTTMRIAMIFTRSGITSSATDATHIAPMVLAIVLRVRMEELVSSISCFCFSKSRPRFGWLLVKAWISAVVVLRMKASNSEQKPETIRVKQTGKISDVIREAESPIARAAPISLVESNLLVAPPCDDK